MRRGRNWFFLGLTYASYYLCRYNLSPIAPDLMKDLDLTKSQYGLINSGRDGAYAVGQMINGLFTDRVGGKQAMTIGALSTVLLNLAFGFTTWSKFAFLLPLLVFIRSLDGYMQAFGAPGMIKINTAWFRRQERGAFAGIFGAMINLGAIGAGWLGTLLVKGAAIPLLFFTLTIPALNWRYMFFIPPVVVIVVIILMNLNVKNNPEEAGYQIIHDEEVEERRKKELAQREASAGSDSAAPARVERKIAPVPEQEERVRLMEVVRIIASNPVVWIVAGAYFCTGFVRRGIESWCYIYLDEVWLAGRSSSLYWMMFISLPVTATIGSLSSGYISDLWFRGRRAPVAAALYIAQVLFTIVAMLLPQGGSSHSAAIFAVTSIIMISMMCNSTHSILGTAAAMDLGGRKMAGCASGIIDSFQYYGALISGYGLGVIFEKFATVSPGAAGGATKLNPQIWLGSMIPFGLLGAGLMIYLCIKHGKSGTRGT